MKPRSSRCAIQLREQIDDTFTDRDQTSDGWIVGGGGFGATNGKNGGSGGGAGARTIAVGGTSTQTGGGGTGYGFAGGLVTATTAAAGGGGSGGLGQTTGAAIGYTYDANRNAFIPLKPDNATGFDEITCQWIVIIDDSNQL